LLQNKWERYHFWVDNSDLKSEDAKRFTVLLEQQRLTAKRFVWKPAHGQVFGGKNSEGGFKHSHMVALAQPGDAARTSPRLIDTSTRHEQNQG
jgi:hypothetical protein